MSFFLLKKGIRFWFFFTIIIFISFFIIGISFLSYRDLLDRNLKDIFKGNELKVLSLIFHGFSIPHSIFDSYDTYEFLLNKEDGLSVYYYNQKKETGDLSIYSEFNPLTEGRIFLYQGLKRNNFIYALPFSFSLKNEIWDCVLFYNEEEDEYYLYVLITSKSGEEDTYLLFYQKGEIGFLEDDPFPFMLDLNSHTRERSLLLSEDFFLIWPSVFKKSYARLEGLRRSLSDLNKI